MCSNRQKVVDAFIKSFQAPSMASAAPCFLALKFRLENAKTQWGESLLIVGSCPELGSWRPEEGISLHTCELTYPEWRSQEVIFKVSSSSACQFLTFRYKYVSDRRALGGEFAWEESIDDREVRIPFENGGVVEICDDIFNVASQAQISHLQEPRRENVLQAHEGSLSAIDTPPVAAFTRHHAESVDNQKAASKKIETSSFLNAYDLLGDGPLASGGFSCVWRCSPHGKPSETRAVKLVHLEQLSQRGRRLLFGHMNRPGEIQLHQSLRHPHIVELVEVFQDPGVVSLVMECCYGGDLLEILLSHREVHRRGLPEDAAARVMSHICLALSHLHENLIVHRDVKCENVLQMEVRGTSLDVATFKLGDFGLAAQLLKDQVLLEQVGSPSTSAPEVIRGRPYAMPADMWSAGATLFTILAAQRPFDGFPHSQALGMAANCKVPLQGGCWETVSESARSLVERLLHSDPLRRSTAQAALQHPWLSRMNGDACQ